MHLLYGKTITCASLWETSISTYSCILQYQGRKEFNRNTNFPLFLLNEDFAQYWGWFGPTPVTSRSVLHIQVLLLEKRHPFDVYFVSWVTQRACRLVWHWSLEGTPHNLNNSLFHFLGPHTSSKLPHCFVWFWNISHLFMNFAHCNCCHDDSTLAVVTFRVLAPGLLHNVLFAAKNDVAQWQDMN